MEKRFKPERKLYKGFYWRVNFDWIKKEMCNAYLGVNDNDLTRELIITKLNNNLGEIGTYFFYLSGSPPKAYAIYIPYRNKLMVLGRDFIYKRNFENIKIKEFEERDEK